MSLFERPCLRQVARDVALLQEVGANFVRGAHYPQDQRFLDLCDEAGIGVWEEALGPGTSVDRLTDDVFLRAQVRRRFEAGPGDREGSLSLG